VAEVDPEAECVRDDVESDGVPPGLAGADLGRALDGHDEDFAVAGFAGFGTIADGIDDLLGRDVRDDAPILTFWWRSTVYSSPRHCPFFAGCEPRPETLVTVSDGAPASARDFLISPRRSGRTIAVTILISPSFGSPPSERSSDEDRDSPNRSPPSARMISSLPPSVATSGCPNSG